MVALYLAGEHEKALELQKKYLDMENAMFIDVNPIPVKEAMNMVGWKAGECRLPLYRMEDAKIAKLRAELEKVGLIK